MKRTKIICTLGPASTNEDMMREMLLSGMNVARFNMSHGNHKEHEDRIAMFRKVRDGLGMPAAVLLDMKGPEIRLKDFENGSVILNEGDIFVLTSEDVMGDEKKASVTYSDLPKDIKDGYKVLIDDGKVVLEVMSHDDKDIVCKVVYGGKVSNHKGVNVPSIHLNMPYLSEVDKQDLLFGIKQDVDFVAASFVRTKEDIKSIRDFLDYNGGKKIRIIAKIENQEGIDNFDEILPLSNGIMVARGDMGVEVDYEKLPGIQKRFIAKCRKAGKIVVTATQMLESMVNNPSPTRAEISDVANAVFDGTSAIMLSGETANGKYPVQTVKTMAKIARRAEQDAFELGVYDKIEADLDADHTQAISHATCTTAEDLKAKVIIAVTLYGTTARRISKFRPSVPIVAATPDIKTYHQLALSWGVSPVISLPQNATDELFDHVIYCAKQNNYVEDGDTVVITAGVPLGVSGGTNTVKVQKVSTKQI